MNSVSLTETIQSAAIDGLQRWRSNDYLDETARTRLGYNLSRILLGVTSSIGGNWIREESECFRFAEVGYMDSSGGYHDDMSGGRLDPAAVIKAREEEMSFIRSYNVYVKAPLAESYRETGKGSSVH